MANTIDAPSDVGVYKLEFETKLQERLNKPTTWKDVCDVRFTSAYAINLPYMSTEPVAQTGTRGTAYGFSDFTLTNEQLNVNVKKLVPVFADEADLAQTAFIDQMDMADRSGKLLSDQIETAVLADHANWTNVGDTGGVITSGSTGAITVSATNIDDIVRGVRRILIEGNGGDQMDRNGLFFVWRPADFEYLEQFAQANGFNLADAALKNGIERGYYLLGAYHYVSNSHTANHVFAGVRRIMKVGVLRQTWGKLKVTEDPGLQSGKGMISRVDFGVKTPTGLKALLLDVNVA
jgi:hypothetical protein